MRLYRYYLKDYKFHLIFGPLFKLVEVVFELIVPLVMRDLINNGILLKDVNYVIKRGLLLFLFAIIGLSSTIICQYLASSCCQKVATKMRYDGIRKITSLSKKELDDFSSSQLLTRMTSDIYQVQTSIALFIRLAVRAPFLVIGSIIMTYILNPYMAIIFVVSACLLAFIIYLVMKISIPKSKAILENMEELSSKTMENLHGVRLVRSFNQEQKEQAKFKKILDNNLSLNLKLGKISSLLNPLSYVITSTSIVLILYFGGYFVSQNALKSGDVYALTYYMTQIFLAIVVLANLVLIFNKSLASEKRLLQLFDKKSSLQYGDINDHESDELIKFSDVSFAYNQNDTLKKISFTIKKGEQIGIIGSTASGKSTLIYLMMRLYDPQEGVIYFKGRNIKDYTKKSLIDAFSLVFQNQKLETGTIYSNLTLSKKYSEEEIKLALDVACCDFVKCLDDEVLRDGKNFSGGQKKRLNLACGLLKKSEVLILDDAFSALDYKTDLEVRKKIKENYQKTIIYITERVSSIKDCDRIIVLDNGRIDGFDTHENLLQYSKVYQELALSQSREGLND